MLQTVRLPLIVALVALCALAGCSSNPVAIAETPLQTAYAIEASYNIVLEHAVELAEANQGVREAVLRVEARTTPIIDSLGAAIVDYVTAKSAFALGESTEARIAVVAANLESWIGQAQRALVDLAAAVD